MKGWCFNADVSGVPNETNRPPRARRHVLRTDAASRRVRAAEIREARAVILREFGPDGLERLETGHRVRSLESWAVELEEDAVGLFASADALAPKVTP